LAYHTWPDLKSYSLGALAGKFNITYKAHNALEDAMSCGKLVQMAAEKYSAQSEYGNVNSIEQLLEAAGIGMNSLSN
jgi:DNA polymerase-3 subunit epsilon